MRHIIEKLKDKPSHVKQMVALFTALSITGIVAICWVLGIIYGGIASPKEATVASERKDGEPSPLTVIKTQISDFAKTAGDQMAGANNAFNSMTQQEISASSTASNQ